MEKPTHIDIVALEARIRSMNAAMEEAARSRAPDAKSHRLIDMQIEAMEVFIAVHKLVAKWRNEETNPRLIAQALGNLLGMSAGAVVSSQPGLTGVLQKYLGQALYACATGTTPAGATSKTEMMPIATGGSA